jgi:hypothetical protein
MTNEEWLTTNPHPEAFIGGYDAGQRGWRLHRVNLGGSTRTDWYNGEEIDISPALCGLRPAHGWGLDLYIEEKCKRCLRALARDPDRNPND